MSKARVDISPEAQLDGFLSKYTPEIRAVAEQARAKMRARFPNAIEMVYDNYNALVIGYSPTERVSEAIFSIALYPRWVMLFFLDGVGLPDPENLLRGGGKIVRGIRFEDASILDKPAVRTLMKHALKRLDSPFDKKTPGRLVIKSISAKQRPRRPS